MARKIFYSWQSDLPNATNRGFIHTALEAACVEVAKDVAVEERPEVDRDTQGVPGAPDIASTIFGKIDLADVFLADISIVAKAEGERPCPNPNVLIELGYAIKALGWERVLLVMNTAYGGPELLPFDLKTKRVMPYASEADAAERAPERRKLQSTLKSALTIILQHLAQPLPGTEIRPDSLRELASAAIEASKPSAPAAVRRFMQWFGEQLESVAPKKIGDEPADDALVRALEGTKAALAEFALLAESVAVHDSKEGARAVFKGFEYVLLQYDAKGGGGQSWFDTDFDLAKFAGHEAFVMFIALLIREGRWHIIADVLCEEVIVKNVRGTNPCRFDAISSHVKLLAMRKERLKLDRRSVHADLLKERHESGELSKLVPFTEFMAADLLLFLRGQLESEQASSWSARWAPWSSVFLERGDPPRFLIEAKRAAMAAQLASALGVAGVDELRDRFAARMKPMNELLRGRSCFWDGPFHNFKPAEIGTR